MAITAAELAPVHEALDGEWTVFDGAEEIIVAPGPDYRHDDPVRIRVCRRGRRYDLSDDGAAVDRAGRPNGWREVMERLVALDGFNVNRRGALFVPVVAGRDIAQLAVRLAATSRSCYLALLELRADDE